MLSMLTLIWVALLIVTHSPYFTLWFLAFALTAEYVSLVPSILLGISLYKVIRQNQLMQGDSLLKTIKLKYWYMSLHFTIIVIVVAI